MDFYFLINCSTSLYNRPKKSFHIFGAIAIVLILWQSLVSLGGWNEALLPPPSRVAAGFGELLTDGVLLADIKSSLLRFAAGYLSSVLIAIFLGLLLGWYKNIWAFLNPIAQVLRPISPIIRTSRAVSHRNISRQKTRYCPFPCNGFPTRTSPSASRPMLN